MSGQHASESFAKVGRRKLLRNAAMAAGALTLAACSAPPSPTAAPAKPTEAPKPAAPTTAPAAAATTAPAAAATTAPAAATKPATAATAAPAAAATTAPVGSPTAAPAAAPAAVKPSEKGAVVPTPRNQTVVIDRPVFTVFDGFTAFIPNGQEYSAGFQQVCKEFLFYANYAAGKIEPWLATGWKYNAGFTELTLSLNPKAKWNDGKPFTSKDVKFTIEMAQKNTNLLTFADVRRFIDSVATPDDQTVVMKLKSANPRMHYVFICGIVNGFEVVPEHVWSGKDPNTYRDNPPTRTGPYKLEKVISDQQMFIWKKNPDYWAKDVFNPAPEYAVFRGSPVQDSAVEEFKRAQTDHVTSYVDYPHMKQIKDSGYQPMIIETAFRDPCPRAIWVNSDPSKGILADPKAHWALSYLLDRKKIGDTLWLIQTPPAQYPWADYKSNSRWENKEIADQYALTYNPQKAASLFDELGAKLVDGKRMFQGKQLSWEISTPALVGNPEYNIGQMLVDELKKLGVDAAVKSYSNPVFTQKYGTGDFDIISYWLCGVSFDPGQLYTLLESDKVLPIGQVAVNGNQYRFKDADLNDAATKLDVADPTDPANKALFDKALGAYFKALPGIPVIQTTYPAMFNTTYWTGWPSDEDLFHVPLSWWGQFLFTIGRLKATGKT
jgi:peptide/nickel transport system substrate-binding protein